MPASCSSATGRRSSTTAPINLFVAGFMGSPAMNLYEATTGSGARSARLGSQEIVLSPALLQARPGLSAYAERKIVLGIRPEELALARDDGGPASPTIAADVELVEALGSESLVHFRLDAQRVVAIDSVDEKELGEIVGSGVARLPARTAITTGDRVSLAINESALHFFDPSSGLAISGAA